MIFLIVLAGAVFALDTVLVVDRHDEKGLASFTYLVPKHPRKLVALKTPKHVTEIVNSNDVTSTIGITCQADNCHDCFVSIPVSFFKADETVHCDISKDSIVERNHQGECRVVVDIRSTEIKPKSNTVTCQILPPSMSSLKGTLRYSTQSNHETHVVPNLKATFGLELNNHLNQPLSISCAPGKYCECSVNFLNGGIFHREGEFGELPQEVSCLTLKEEHGIDIPVRDGQGNCHIEFDTESVFHMAQYLSTHFLKPDDRSEGVMCRTVAKTSTSMARGGTVVAIVRVPPSELPLPSDFDDVVKAGYAKGPRDVLAEIPREALIRGENLATLRPKEYVDDHIIDFHSAMLRKEYPYAQVFTTRVMEMVGKGEYEHVIDWFLEHDMSFYNDKGETLMLLPVHLGAHWILATIRMNAKRVNIYDSLHHKYPKIMDQISTLLKESSAVYGFEFDATKWTFEETPETYPRQSNGYACGIFVMLAMRDLLKHEHPTFLFEQEHMPYYRQKLAYDLLKSYPIH